MASPIMPTPPRPTSSTGPRAACGTQPLERRIGGEARAHQRARERRRQRRIFDQIARMRHQHVRGKAAVGGDAEMAVGRAQIFLAGAAGRAGAAADPGIDRDLRAGLRARGVRSRALDHARDLVAERERQRAAGAHVERLAVAEREIAVLHVQVGMADAAALDAHQHLGALRLRAIDDGLAERGFIGGEREAAELVSCAGILARRIRQRAREGCDESLRPECPRRARSARCRRPRAAAADRCRAIRRLWRSILRRWPKAASVTRSSAARSQGSGVGARHELRPPTTSPWAAARRRTG